MVLEVSRFQVGPSIFTPAMFPETSDCFVVKEDRAMVDDTRVVAKDMVERVSQP